MSASLGVFQGPRDRASDAVVSRVNLAENIKEQSCALGFKVHCRRRAAMESK